MLHWSADYSDIPFLAKGRDRDGCDCWGLVRVVLRERFNISVPSYDDSYATTNDDSVGVLFGVAEYMYQRIAPGSEREGDIVAFKTGRLRYHVGIVVGRCEMLHIMHGCNSVVERYDECLGIGELHGFYRAE